MSVNTGGFFFSNPTSAHLPKNEEDEERNAAAAGYGGNVGCNFTAGHDQQQIVNAMNANNNRNQRQGNFSLNNAAANVSANGNPMMIPGNAINTVGNAVNNPIFTNPNQIMANNNLANSGNAVQNTGNTGFGSFFFNPLALFTNGSNGGNPVATNNNTAAASTSMITNRLLNNTILENRNLANNAAIGANTMTNAPGGVYQQHNLPSQMDVPKPPAPQDDQFGVAASMSQSPAPMAFLTPNQGPTPCPPMDISKSPMFLDAHSFAPTDSDAHAQQLSLAFNDDTLCAVNRAAAIDQGTNVQPATVQGSATTSSSTSTSLLARGISSVGMALGTVATYVNQSFLSGIPFHIADRAMKDSKETYTKWWGDGGISTYHAKKKRKGSTDEEDNMEDSDDDEDGAGPGAKRRRLDMDERDRGGGGQGTGGSDLSASLKKHYDDMGIDTSSRFVEYQQQGDMGALLNIEVDGSIIKSRRGQFERERTEPARRRAGSGAESTRRNADGYNAFNDIGGMYDFGEAAEHQAEHDIPMEAELAPAKVESSSDGYNAFNNIGGMYDFGAGDDGDAENEKEGAGEDAGLSLTYDSLGSFYTTNDDNDHASGDGEPSSNPSEAGNAATMTSNSTLDGTMQVIQELLEEKNRASEENEMLQMLAAPRDWVKKSIRSELIDALQNVRGDVKDKRFLGSLDILSNFYKTSGRDARVSPWSGRRTSDPGVDGGTYGYSGSEIGGPTSSDLLEGSWLNMSRPNYVECLGTNPENDFMYTLGRMSFDMFQPGGLICSVQSTHNTIKIIGEREELPAHVPKSLRDEVISLCDSSGGDGAGSKSRPLLRAYDIAVSLTIEPPSTVGQPEPPATPTPPKRMRALMSVKGYVLPDPNTPNRLTVWFTGGKLSPARLPSEDGAETDDEDQAEYNQSISSAAKAPAAGGGGSNDDGYGGFEDWTAMFSKGKWRKSLGERARAMAAKLLLGADVPNKMEEDGHMEYTLHRPVGGHGKVYVDVLYLDEDILIMRGHHGTIYAMARSGVSQRYRAMRGKLQSKTDG